MQRRKSLWIGLLILVWAPLTGGCIDAVTEGITEGLTAGVAVVIQSIFESSLEN